MSSHAVHIRRAEPGDAATIVAMIKDLAEYEQLSHECRADEASITRHLFGEGFGRGPVAECLIGEVDGRAEGFALFFTNFSTFLCRPGIYLEDLFVRPASRGLGLGKALLRELARLAVDRGCGRVEWSVLDWNTPAIDFYRSVGAGPMTEWTTFRLTAEPLAAFASGQ